MMSAVMQVFVMCASLPGVTVRYHAKNKKTNRIIVEILFYYSSFKKNIFIFLNSQG